MHVTCAVDRLVINEQSVYNTRTKTIISRKKNLNYKTSFKKIMVKLFNK